MPRVDNDDRRLCLRGCPICLFQCPRGHALSCHCGDCQRSSGAAFASGIVVHVADVQVTGNPATYTVRGDSGGSTTRSFCSHCGSPLFTRGEVVPHLISIRSASLDDATAFKPMVDIWTASAQPWVRLDPDIPHVPRSP